VADAALAARDAAGALELCWSYVTARPQGAMLETVLDTFTRALGQSGGVAPARAWDARVRVAKGLASPIAVRLRIACASLILRENAGEARAILAEVRSKPLADRAAAEAGLLAGRIDVAAAATSSALETFESLAASRADRIGAEARKEKALLLESIGRTDEAVEEFLTIAYLFPDIEDLAAEGLAEAARIARARGERERARSFEDRLRKEYPNSDRAKALGAER